MRPVNGTSECPRNCARLEIAKRLANHESTRTSGLSGRRGDQASLDDVEQPPI